VDGADFLLLFSPCFDKKKCVSFLQKPPLFKSMRQRKFSSSGEWRKLKGLPPGKRECESLKPRDQIKNPLK